jgi:hypothetical protein
MRAWFAAAILIAPNIIAFHRILWDASFTIPLSALVLAALADFLKTKRRWSLRLCVVCTVLLPIIHPQALPLAVPIAAYLLWRHRADFKADRAAMWRTGAVLFVLHFLYIGAVIGVLHWRFTHGGNVQYPKTVPRLESALGIFVGGNLLNGFDYAKSVVRPEGPAWLVDSAMWISRMIYPVVWLGIIAAALRVKITLRALRDRITPEPRDVLATLAIVCLAAQFALFNALRLPTGLQYFFGTFGLHVFLAFLGIEMLGRVRLALPVGVALLAANTFITVGAMRAFSGHCLEAPGWPTLSNCVGAVQQLNRYANQVVLTDVDFFQRYPQPIRTLRLLIPPDSGPKPKARRLLLSYKREDGKQTGEFTVTELANDQKRPPGAVLMDVTPLPEGWVPDPSTW